MTFVERLRAGDFDHLDDDEINDLADDEVGAWHDRNPLNLMHLHEHLGMTYDEFARWVRDPGYIAKIKEAT